MYFSMIINGGCLFHLDCPTKLKRGTYVKEQDEKCCYDYGHDNGRWVCLFLHMQYLKD